MEVLSYCACREIAQHVLPSMPWRPVSGRHHTPCPASRTPATHLSVSTLFEDTCSGRVQRLGPLAEAFDALLQLIELRRVGQRAHQGLDGNVSIALLPTMKHTDGFTVRCKQQATTHRAEECLTMAAQRDAAACLCVKWCDMNPTIVLVCVCARVLGFPSTRQQSGWEHV